MAQSFTILAGTWDGERRIYLNSGLQRLSSIFGRPLAWVLLFEIPRAPLCVKGQFYLLPQAFKLKSGMTRSIFSSPQSVGCSSPPCFWCRPSSPMTFSLVLRCMTHLGRWSAASCMHQRRKINAVKSWRAPLSYTPVRAIQPWFNPAPLAWASWCWPAPLPKPHLK